MVSQSISIQPSSTGYISKDIALCRKGHIRDARANVLLAIQPLVTPALNEEKKTALREHKAKLEERRDGLRALFGFVEEGVYRGLLRFHTLYANNYLRL
jgi:uncharacterized protein YbgA (DUF1722 family)